MRFLIALALLTAVMAGMVVLLISVGTAMARAGGDAMAEGPMRSGTVPKIAFALLWLLIAGTAVGLIGGA